MQLQKKNQRNGYKYFEQFGINRIMKIFISFLIICCAILNVLAIINTIRFKRLKIKTRKKH